MTKLPIFYNWGNDQEAMRNHRFLVRVRLLLCCLLTALLLVSFSPLPSIAYAALAEHENGYEDPVSDGTSIDIPDQPEFKEEDDVVVDAFADESVLRNDGISLSLSEPEIWQEGDMICYKTLLTVKGVHAFFGYQIQVEASSEEDTQIVNVFDGVNTDSVYKESNLYLASMNTAKASGDVSTCEIIAKYPVTDSSTDKQLVVRSFQVVTSISPEAIMTIGPDPAAAVLDLPLPTNSLNLIPLFIIIAVCIIAIVVSLLIRNKIKNRSSEKAVFTPLP